MSNPITPTPQLTRLEVAAATQAGSPLILLDPALLSPILTQMGIKDVAAYLNTCRFARMEHFENKAVWMELFKSRFPNRTHLLKELGPFEAYRDLHQYPLPSRTGHVYFLSSAEEVFSKSCSSLL